MSPSRSKRVGSASKQKSAQSPSKRNKAAASLSKHRPPSKRQAARSATDPSQAVAYIATPRLPNDIVYTILSHVIGAYFYDLIFTCHLNSYLGDTLTSILLVSRSFRADASQLIHHLWGGSFVEGSGIRRRVPADYGQTLSGLSRLARAAHLSPIELVVNPSAFYVHRLLRHPIHPFIILGKFYFVNMARINARQTRKPWDLPVPIQHVFNIAEVDFPQLVAHYWSIPGYLRLALFGKMWFDFVHKLVIWERLRVLSGIVDTLYKVLSLYPPKSLNYQLRLKLEDEICEHLEDARDERQTLQTSLERISKAANIDLCELPRFTWDELGSIRFYRLLGVLDGLEQFGARFEEIREMGRDSLQLFLSDEEVNLFMY